MLIGILAATTSQKAEANPEHRHPSYREQALGLVYILGLAHSITHRNEFVHSNLVYVA